MRTSVTRLLLCILSFALGCCTTPLGGGVTTVAGRCVNYAARGDELVCVIFTDIAADNAEASADASLRPFSTKYHGYVKSSAGAMLRYDGDRKHITVAGQRFSLAAGRVFLVTTRGTAFKVKQVDCAFAKDSCLHRDEIARIARKCDAVKLFLPRPAAGAQ